MWDQEKEHKGKFEELLPKYKILPTALLPVWNIARCEICARCRDSTNQQRSSHGMHHGS